MQAILGSKLYRTSARKDKILAKLSDPVNTELVTQLREYLDDEYLTTKYFPEDKSDDKDKVEVEDDVEFEPSGHSAPAPHISAPISSKIPEIEDELDEPLDTEVGEEDGELPDDSAETDVDVSEDAEEVEEATTVTSVDEILPTFSLSDIQERLNSNDDTSGIVRTKQKGNEFWIFYNDAINLNSVMGKVIDALSIPEYSYLDFNRLARTDNAIVFEILDR